MSFKYSVIISLIYSSIVFTAFGLNAQNAPITTAATVGVTSPGSISVPVTVTAFNNIGAISLSFDYDYSVLHYNGSTPHPSLSSFSAGDLDLGTGYHRISMGWYGAGTTLADGSTIMTLHFTYISGNTELAWYDNGPSCEYADGNISVLNDIPASTYYINGFVCGLVGDPGEISGSTSVCSGQTGVVYSVAPIENATGYVWDLQDGAVITSGDNTNAISVDFGTMAVSGDITVNGLNYCGSGPLSYLTVEVGSLPIANAGNDTTINYGTVAYLHAAGGEYEVYSYHWSPEELLVNPDEQNPQTVILTQSTLFTVMVTNQATFCQNSDQVIVSITGGPLSVNPVAVPGVICNGESSHLFSNAGGGSGNYSYLWTSDPPGNPPWSSTEANPVVSADSSKIYNLVVNDGFTTVSDAVALLVTSLPTATLSGGDTLCGENGYTTLQVDLTGTPPWSFNYSYGNTTVFITGQQESPYYIIASDPGDYTISAIYDANCYGTPYGTAMVRRFPVPATPEITVNVYELISSSCCGNQWYKNGNAIPGATGQTYHVVENGLYHVVVTLNGCSSAPSEDVDIIVGVEEISRADMNLSIRPNPFTTEATINYTILTGGSVTLEIVSMHGKSIKILVEEQQMPGDYQRNFDAGKLLPGIYTATLRVRSKSDEQVSIIKMVKSQ